MNKRQKRNRKIIKAIILMNIIAIEFIFYMYCINIFIERYLIK